MCSHGNLYQINQFYINIKKNNRIYLVLVNTFIVVMATFLIT